MGIIALAHLDGIDVETKGQGGARATGLQQAHDTGQIPHALEPGGIAPLMQGSGLLGRHIDLTTHHKGGRQQTLPKEQGVSRCLQVTGYQAGSAKLFPGGFGVAVQIPSPRDQLIDVHLFLLVSDTQAIVLPWAWQARGLIFW
ncbi:hypothetical protein WL1483_2739 [Aeromonas schubertii]|uniref:Uncharacterized protein n=1 Tax=Aeromonas schubertii TaxID=652 RepID=A0A0S2SKP9_9GAMM|nr:hypothetical protein WL1483_2739 [Aeromonas schubertii]